MIVQSENIFNMRKEVNDDQKELSNDKPYAIEFFKAQDNPIEYYQIHYLDYFCNIQ